MNDRDCWTLDAMDKYGGGFIKSLSTLARHADSVNLLKIKAKWEEYWLEYETAGRKMEKESLINMCWHKWTKWKRLKEGTLHRQSDKAQIGYFIYQVRECETCGEEQLNKIEKE